MLNYFICKPTPTVERNLYSSDFCAGHSVHQSIMDGSHISANGF